MDDVQVHEVVLKSRKLFTTKFCPVNKIGVNKLINNSEFFDM